MKKLIAIQSQLKAPKNLVNKHGGYNYRSQEDILEAVKPLLYEYGCTLTITDEIVLLGDHCEAQIHHVDAGNDKYGKPTFLKQIIQETGRVYIKATAVFTDGEQQVSVNGYAREATIKKGMDESQITGSASSYARKYALNGLFLIDDTKDADATNDHDKGKPELKEGSQAYHGVIKYLAKGNDWTEVEKKYTVSPQVKKAINEKLQKDA